VSLSTQQLRDRLDAIIKLNPKIGNLPISLLQFDTDTAEKTGEELCDGVDVRHDRVVLG
jgi:hypothetical protein